MADVDFPKFIRGPLKASKSRNVSEAYRQNQPFSGPAYTESLTDDTPVIYNIQFAFTNDYRRAFIAWLEDANYCNKGRSEFNIDIETEQGLITQEARFTQGGYPQLQREENQVFFYSAQIVIRKLNNPDEGFADEILFLVENSPGGNIDLGAELLDYAMNEDWPES